MPLPPSYKCPVCQKERQRGLLGEHLVQHTKEELTPFIINLDVCAKEANWHPQIICSGHTYILCKNNKVGFEEGFKLHKTHICTQDYSDWTSVHKKPTKDKTNKLYNKTNKLYNKTMKEVIDICKEKKITGYSGKRKFEIIKMIEEYDACGAKCTCHIEITKLKAELEEFKKWKHTILTCMPGTKYEAEEIVVTMPETNTLNIITNPLPQQDVSHQDEAKTSPKTDTENADKEIPKTTIKRPFVPKASKKEIEKGMWCTRCESCRYVAQYTKDLKPCGNCHKLCHFNDDMGNCYLWDCVVCNKAVCKECNKVAGGNRLNPYCSKACASSLDN